MNATEYRASRTKQFEEATERAFGVLEQCAAKRERCPVTSGPCAHPWINSQHIRKLARQGRIFVEVSSRNWRVVTILKGQHKGKQTAPNPHRGQRVYKTMGVEGSRVNGRPVMTKTPDHRQPSAPPRLKFQDLPEVDW